MKGNEEVNADRQERDSLVPDERAIHASHTKSAMAREVS
jgi:hypothetical protein